MGIIKHLRPLDKFVQITYNIYNTDKAMTKTKRKDNGAARKEFTSSPPTTLSVVGPRLYTNRKDKMTKQKHTPGTDCGCEPDGVFVNLCPLHAAAPELLEALEKTLEILTTLIVKERTQ